MVLDVDIVIVSHNSRDHLRACVEPLRHIEGVNVIVVDNASNDGSLDSVADMPLATVPLSQNGGFAHGCNTGWRRGRAPYVLFLNPDARIDRRSLGHLVATLEAEERVGAVGPKIVDPYGVIHYSQRRFPTLSSLYAQAFYAHRVLPRARWSDELVRDEALYRAPSSPDWVSGACILVRRVALDLLGGFDEGFFMYWEDTDLCRRLRDHGFDVRYEPAAVVVHVGGASRPRSTLLPVLASSRIRYCRKHRGQIAVFFERLGLALGAVTHAVGTREGGRARLGHFRSLLIAMRPLKPGLGRASGG
jgi:N-acetylglucosaminyl-diphospho-decaprenol L-rhamnosyltransferase